MPTKVTKLQTGDYSVLGLENVVSVERKSLDDLIGSFLTSNRDRFNSEIDRLVNFQAKALVCEGSWNDITEARYRSRMHPNAAFGSIMSLIERGVPVVMAGSRSNAERVTYSVLRLAYNRAQIVLSKLAPGKLNKTSSIAS